MASQTMQPRPSPDLILDTLNAYQRTAALWAATIRLDARRMAREGVFLNRL